MTYDVFLSHRGEYKPWINTLAENLTQHGYKVFLDTNELTVGNHWVDELARAIQSSRHGIIAVTSDTMESGWVRMEYRKMLNRSINENNFRLIPIILDEIPDLPFIDMIHYVDFRPPKDYREAFHELDCGLKGKSPGEPQAFNGALTIPKPIAKSALANPKPAFLDKLFNKLKHSRNRMVVLLAQDQMHINYQQIMTRAKTEFDRIIRLVPPFAETTTPNEYFQYLAQRAGFDDPVNTPTEFELALSRQLDSGEKNLIYISSLEHGHREGRRLLAGIIRNLYANQTRPYTLITGGNKLVELTYNASSQLSPLNIAKEMHVAEPTPEDVQKIQQEFYPDHPRHPITLEQAKLLLRLTGGHPRLIDEGLESGKTNAEELITALRQSTIIWRDFAAAHNAGHDGDDLSMVLEEDNLGAANPYEHDPLLRHLYWRNLMKSEMIGGSRRLIWRCEVIREIGRRFVGSFNE